eukprot:TRINITY_DN6325_c0_g2_i1.p1 TRINITY_DN6325_c0_g2~~TRINITY_DN6325_c0_g2_i1.p1  ORF type:complete len:108 (-),score=20.12 TRINITY_DN6325_c0_g2_i1:48-371(-)
MHKQMMGNHLSLSPPRYFSQLEIPNTMSSPDITTYSNPKVFTPSSGNKQQIVAPNPIPNPVSSSNMNSSTVQHHQVPANIKPFSRKQSSPKLQEKASPEVAQKNKRR